MPLEIVRNDITHMRVDAIVNSANPQPVVGRGVDAAIHGAAGPALLAQRRHIGDIPVGTAVVTDAGDLPARFVIHTVGPVWRGGKAAEAQDVASCYRNSLQAAVDNGCSTVAFPLISTGTYGFPKDLALRVATQTIRAFLLEHDLDVFLVVHDDESFRLSQSLFEQVEDFIGSNLEFAPDGGVPFAAASAPDGSSAPLAAHEEERGVFCGSASPRCARFLGAREMASAPVAVAAPESSQRRLEDVVGQVEESFSECLLRMIDERGLADPQVYRRANIDRKLFSKIRSRKDYRPSKATALALAVALELNLDETKDLIARAGYALTHASKADLIVEYFIVNGVHDVLQINEALFAFNQPLIGR